MSDLLDRLRFDGWFFCLSEMTAPWAVQLPGGRLAAIHVVLEGACILEVARGAHRVSLRAGDIAVLPRDEVHVVADRRGRIALPATAIPGIDPHDRTVLRLRHGGGGSMTRLLSASFDAETDEPSALLAGLPPLIALRVGTRAAARLSPVVALIRAEADAFEEGSPAVLRRSAETLFVQALRETLLSSRVDSGWLAAAADPRLAAALSAIHLRPERAWTLPALARLVHLSRSTFFDRFQACMGMTPAEYLNRVRLARAAERLAGSRESIGAIAASVGYESPSAFARAFRRATGASPTAFRINPSSGPTPASAGGSGRRGRSSP